MRHKAVTCVNVTQYVIGLTSEEMSIIEDRNYEARGNRELDLYEQIDGLYDVFGATAPSTMESCIFYFVEADMDNEEVHQKVIETIRNYLS